MSKKLLVAHNEFREDLHGEFVAFFKVLFLDWLRTDVDKVDDDDDLNNLVQEMLYLGYKRLDVYSRDVLINYYQNNVDAFNQFSS